MSEFGLIEVGSSVQIQRSNGRVHKAIVTKLNLSSSAVTVEWYEDEETKGKEIEICLIFQLNPELRPQENNIPQKPTVSKVALKPQERSVSRSKSFKIFEAYFKNIQKELQKCDPPVRSTRQTNVFRKPNLPRPTNHEPAAASKQQTRSRRSNVVDEVEKLRKNREERRAAQNMERERRQMFCDPSNPSWEFLAMVKEFRETLEINPLKSLEEAFDHRICVCVRKRPLNKKEVNKKEIDVITIPTSNKILLSEPKTRLDMSKYIENQSFRFDYTFNEECSNEMVYWYTAKPLVQCVFNGGMATCFAYGQTGSGKTHTMGGNFTSGRNQDTTKGIYALAAQDVFSFLKKPKYKDMFLYASFFEIYSGKVFDLLCDKSRLRVLEDAKQQVQVVGLQEVEVKNLSDVLSLISEGTKCRTSGQTSANQNSSRSHAVFQLILRKNNFRKTLHGKFSLIDLAGNERGADTTSADRQTRIEGAEINKSLLALKECIRAMSQNSKHLPFRASKLTQVLRDSFIGERSRTCMIATLSPGMQSCEHTLNTLRYADRVKELVADEPDDGARRRPAAPVSRNLNPIEETTVHKPDTKSNNDDLDLIGTLCQNEISREMIEVHQTVSTLQEIEEETVECHRKFLDEMKTTTALFEMTEEVDFNPESYIQQLKSNISNIDQAKILLTEKLKAFEQALEDEETISQRNIKR